jgi:predicted MFS family arabinose efflux permease
MIVLGLTFLAAFPLVEKRISSQPFIPWRLLTDRTLLLVCAIDALFLFSNGTYQSYFVSYLQVVYDLSVSHAGYIDGIASVVSGIWKLLIGFFIRGTGHFKWLLVTALAVHALFLGLLIYFRHPGTATGFLVMCQLILGMASGTIVLCMNVGVVATVQHADIAATVALLGVSSYIGSAVGAAVSGAIWTNLLPDRLAHLLPDSAKGDAAAIYGSLQRQLSYPLGSTTRAAIAEAYASTQTWMLTAGTLVAGVALVLALMVKNIRLSEREQVVGVTL